MIKNILLFLTTFLIIPFSKSQSLTPIDAGSKVHFTIKNFGVKIGGDFTGLHGTIKFNKNQLLASNFNVSVNANTINTDNNSRDKHLNKEEYFNSEKFSTLNFVSTTITESTIAGRYFMTGNLTIKGITKPVQFGFSAIESINGYIFNGEFEINRRDFGVGGNSAILADKLKINLNIVAKK